MELEVIEFKLREMLLPVFGIKDVKEIKSESALVNDLGAESIDFVEIIYLIEKNFGVVLKTNEVIIGGINIDPEKLFNDGILTKEGAILINNHLKGSNTKFHTGMTRVELFSSLTVRDFAEAIKLKMPEDK